MNITPLNFERTDETIIASTLPSGWKTTVDSVEYAFPCLKQFRVTKDVASYLIEKAQNAFNTRTQQHHDERRMWARKISSFNQAEKDKALRFCSADGTPISVLFPEIPLVDLGTERGREAYKKAWGEAKEEGRLPVREEVMVRGLDLNTGYVPDPDAGSIAKGESRRFEREAYGDDEEVPASAPVSAPATARAQVEEPEPAAKLPVRVKRPNKDWPMDDLAKYCMSKGFSVTKSDHKVEGKLLELAERAHSEHLQLLAKSGVQVEEV